VTGRSKPSRLLAVATLAGLLVVPASPLVAQEEAAEKEAVERPEELDDQAVDPLLGQLAPGERVHGQQEALGERHLFEPLVAVFTLDLFLDISPHLLFIFNFYSHLLFEFQPAQRLEAAFNLLVLIAVDDAPADDEIGRATAQKNKDQDQEA